MRAHLDELDKVAAAMQEFMANHSNLIEEIKSEFEIKSVELL
ncbi:hypothetical protein KYTH67_08710 [Helicobacter pylori]